MFTTNPDTEIEVERLTHLLADLPIREIATYEQLSEAVGYNIQNKPFALMKARKRVEEQTGLRLGTVKGVGIKKLDAEAICGIGSNARLGIARKARRQAARLTGLRYNDIDAKMQQRIDAERSLLGAISATARADIGRVEEQTSTGPVVAAKIFDLLSKAA